MKEAPGTTDTPLRLFLLEETLAVCRMPADSEVPSWATEGEFFSLTRTADELSIVCAEVLVPESTVCERVWRAIGLEGPLDFSLVGILAGITQPLAEADISVFAVSTYDTDYVLVREEHLDRAVAALTARGYQVNRNTDNKSLKEERCR